MPGTEEIHVVWLQGGGCTGDTISLTNAVDPSIVDVLTGFLPQVTGITVDFHPTIMPQWGHQAVGILQDAEKGKLDPFVLVLEGAIPDEETARKTNGFWAALGEEDGRIVTLSEWMQRLSPKAAAVVAAGTCAAYGGVRRGYPNPTGAKGALDFLGRDWKSALGLPVICVPGCPAHGDHLVKLLGYAVLAVRGLLPLPQLDEYNRPVFLFSERVHDICPRAGYYGDWAYSKEFGQPYCMELLGCKGPQAYCDVSRRGFVEGIGGCTTLGSPCIGCTEPEFPDAPFSPFLKRASSIALFKKSLGKWIRG